MMKRLRTKRTKSSELGCGFFFCVFLVPPALPLLAEVRAPGAGCSRRAVSEGLEGVALTVVVNHSSQAIHSQGHDSSQACTLLGSEPEGEL